MDAWARIFSFGLPTLWRGWVDYWADTACATAAMADIASGKVRPPNGKLLVDALTPGQCDPTDEV